MAVSLLTATADTSPRIRVANDQDKYMCCCNLLHVKTGTYVVAIAETLVWLLQVVSVVSRGGEEGYLANGFWLHMATICILALVIFGLFVGLFFDKPVLLVCHMVVQVIVIVTMGMAAVLIVIMVVFDTSTALSQLLADDDHFHHHSDHHKDHPHGMILPSLMMAVTYLLIFSVQTWFFVVVWRCYYFLRDSKVNDSTTIAVSLDDI